MITPWPCDVSRRASPLIPAPVSPFFLLGRFPKQECFLTIEKFGSARSASAGRDLFVFNGCVIIDTRAAGPMLMLIRTHLTRRARLQVDVCHESFFATKSSAVAEIVYAECPPAITGHFGKNIAVCLRGIY